MSFDEQFARFVRTIEDALVAYMDEHFPQNTLGAAMRWAVEGGGKRIRPVLTLAFCELGGGSAAQALPFAVAVELVHAYSLVHDDLPCMDNADERRGKPSVQKQFGEATALLAGDALLTEAFAALASAQDALVAPAARVLALRAGQGMVGGQYLELAATHWDADALAEITQGKTAALLMAACCLGVIAASPGNAQSLLGAEHYGHGIGLAFQMIDDVFDWTEDTAAGQTTFATLWGADKTRNMAAEMTQTAQLALAYFSGDATFLTELADWLLRRDH
ncbi:MAG: polyprenyl synthetase family protein [Oscillospiraceae bacterium]|jgi:geranylgeranyl pyrophosphate synthase|nr:polyprenyl synthetase family protein [Oscillospiraceae bacterium]